MLTKTLVTLIVAVAMGALLSTTSLADQGSPLTGKVKKIDGTEVDLASYKGKVVLIVNVASRCGYTGQYAGLQKLYDAYKDKGLVVFAVPSDDFHQEKASNGEVKSFCDLNYGITMPMSVISHVTGPQAHPLYLWLKQTTGFEPKWNFNKVLFDGQGKVVGTWRSGTEPMGSEIETEVQRLLS
jgi:glutathione peroxidase